MPGGTRPGHQQPGGEPRDLGGPATRQKAALPAGLPRTEGRDHGDKSLQPQPRWRPTEQVTSFSVAISVCLFMWPGLNAGASALHSPPPLTCAPSGVPFLLIGLRLSLASVLTVPFSPPAEHARTPLYFTPVLKTPSCFPSTSLQRRLPAPGPQNRLLLLLPLPRSSLP